MTWLVLIICVPLIAVPVVLLCGFAGCAQIAGLKDPETPTPTPTAPTLVSAVALGTTGVTLTWTPDTSALFFVERALVGGIFAPVPLGPSGAISLTGTSAIDSVLTGLSEGTMYRYQLKRTRGASAKSAASKVRRVTTLPDKPDNLQTTLAQPGRIKVRWINRTSANPVEFEVERQSPSGTGVFKLITTIPNVSELDDSDPTQVVLNSGTSHTYRVTAVIPQGFADDAQARVKSETSVEIVVAIN